MTPGWGNEGDKVINWGGLLDMYDNAGLSPDSWMHGHFDGQLNFSSNDFDNSWSNYSKSFLVNRKNEVRVLTRRYLEKKQKRLDRRYKKMGKPYGLKVYYAKDGLPGELVQ